MTTPHPKYSLPENKPADLDPSMSAEELARMRKRKHELDTAFKILRKYGYTQQVGGSWTRPRRWPETD